MTKKDYELIAYCIFTANIWPAIDCHSLEEREKETRKKFAEWFAEQLANKNPRFDKDKFLKACGVAQEAECGHGVPKSKQCFDCNKEQR